ncbi:hypothetical protein ES703_94876 [subsurface metagenome]
MTTRIRGKDVGTPFKLNQAQGNGQAVYGAAQALGPGIPQGQAARHDKIIEKLLVDAGRGGEPARRHLPEPGIPSGQHNLPGCLQKAVESLELAHRSVHPYPGVREIARIEGLQGSLAGRRLKTGDSLFCRGDQRGFCRVGGLKLL